MRSWRRFVAIGLVHGLFTEFQLKIVAGINPGGLVAALLFYPLILTLAWAGHRSLERRLSSQWAGDLVHYLVCGCAGLAIEWTLLGNGPGSNAFQPGMFAMWTTFGFGPRVLTREWPAMRASRRRFWRAFALTAALTSVAIVLIRDPQARVVVTVLTLSGTYLVWSAWLLLFAWRQRGGPANR